MVKCRLSLVIVVFLGFLYHEISLGGDSWSFSLPPSTGSLVPVDPLPDGGLNSLDCVALLVLFNPGVVVKGLLNWLAAF